MADLNELLQAVWDESKGLVYEGAPNSVQEVMKTADDHMRQFLFDEPLPPAVAEAFLARLGHAFRKEIAEIMSEIFVESTSPKNVSLASRLAAMKGKYEN